MSEETTVLLVEAEMLPSSLEEQLSKRDVFVEHATSKNIHQVLPVVVPDLVVQAGEVDLETTFASLAADSEPVPLVVIADRATIRKLRTENHKAIKALIPKDLPAAAIAHRLSTMARRSADGRPIDQAPLGPGAQAPKAKPASPSPAEPKAKQTEPARGSLAPAPLAPMQEVKIFDPDEEAKRQAEQEERENSALLEAEAQQRAVEDARQKKKAEAEARARQATEKRRAELERRAQERKELAEARKREREQKARERAQEREVRRSERPAVPTSGSPNKGKPITQSTDPAHAVQKLEPHAGSKFAPDADDADALEQTTQAVNISAFATALDREAENKSSPPAGPARPAPQTEKGTAWGKERDDDELSVILPLPVDMRVALSPQTTDLPKIRLALLDTDLTRADAVAATLRERGMKVHPLTPDADLTRWPMLRRFAPQGLVVDEKSMARGAANWVERFRGDPFLRHVPVILVRFSRLFDEVSTKVTLEPLLHLIEHLGREEFALLVKLGPGHQVDLWLSQVAPYRLVEMLTREDRNTRLDCRSHTERMVWHLGPGYAGRGKLADLDANEPKERLTPEAALTWLLGHEDCQVAVHEHSEPLAHPSESRDADELLRQMTDALGAPERHESVRPASLSRRQEAPGLPQASEGASSASVFAAAASSVGPPDAVDEPIEIPMSRRPLMSAGPRQKLLSGLTSVKRGAQEAVRKYHEGAIKTLEPLHGKVPSKLLRALPWVLPGAVLLLCLLIFALSGGDGEPAHSHGKKAASSTKTDDGAGKAAPVPSPDKQKEKEKPPEVVSEPEDESEANPEVGLWKVAPDANLKTCEQRLGPSAPKSEDSVKSLGYWRNARRLLMVGKSDEALENMCLAGLFDPNGPATEGLAEYYLGRRSLKQAERWIQASLKADPERRKSIELLGDIENQKGNVEESKKILLSTLKLTGDETRKMEVTARKFKQEAHQARQGGDLPRAERKLRRAALLSPTDPLIAIDLSETLLRRKAPKAAALWAAQALKLDPNSGEAILLSGRIAELQGKKAEARNFYEMVPLGDPLHGEAQKRRGRL